MTNDDAGRHPRRLLSPYLDGELGPDERALLAAHLEQCAGCRALLDDLRTLAAGIAMEEPPLPPADLAARIGRRVGALGGTAKVIPMRRPVWRSPLVVGSMAAALAVAMVTAVWFSARPPAMLREENVVVAQAPSPPPEADRMAMSRAKGTAPSAQGLAAGDRDAGGAGDEVSSGIGMQGNKKVAAEAPGVADKEQAAAAPVRVAGNGAREGAASETGEPTDQLANQAMMMSPDKRGAAADVDAGEEMVAEGGSAVPTEAKSMPVMARPDPVAQSGAAHGESPVVEPQRSRSLELLNSDYHAILSEDGALTFRAGTYECVVPAGAAAGAAPRMSPADIASSDSLSPEVREIFALAAAEQSRRVAARNEEGPWTAGARHDAAQRSFQFAPSASPDVLTLRDANETPLYRETSIPGRDAGGAPSAASIAARLNRLIRENYLQLMERGCGPLPPELQSGERPEPE